MNAKSKALDNDKEERRRYVRHEQLSDFHGAIVNDRDVVARAPRLLLKLLGTTDKLIYLLQSTNISISTRTRIHSLL